MTTSSPACPDGINPNWPGRFPQTNHWTALNWLSRWYVLEKANFLKSSWFLGSFGIAAARVR
jgi:hypothetical protein